MPSSTDDCQADNANGAANTPDNSEDDKEKDPPHSKREGIPTEKMKALMQEEQTKHEEKFSRYYERWKQQVKTTRTRLKQESTEDELGDLIQAVESLESSLLQVYNDIRQHVTPPQPLKRRMDACAAVTLDLITLMQHCLSEAGDDWDERAERLRLHSLLDKHYTHSIFGSLLQASVTPSESGKSQRSSSCRSKTASIAGKRAEAAA